MRFARSAGEPDLLAIYLNNHLAGSGGGVDLVRRMARTQRSTPLGTPLRQLASGIADDQAALRRIMHLLNVPERPLYVWLGRAGEKIGRLKPNGHLLRRSPLSTLIELEALRLGVLGKLELWTALAHSMGDDPRLTLERLDELAGRAQQQADLIEDLRLQAATVLTAHR